MIDVARIALIPPSQPDLRAWWRRAMTRAAVSATVVSSMTACEQYLNDSQTLAYVVFGDVAWWSLLGSQERVRAALQGKAVYRFGCTDDTEARALMRTGLAAFIGYERDLSFVLGTEFRESAFFRPILAGVEALQEQGQIRDVAQAIRESWRQIERDVVLTPGTDSRELLIRLFASNGRKGLFQSGDTSWRFSSRPDVVILDALPFGSAGIHRDESNDTADAELLDELRPRNLTPRVEVIDVTPIFLERLKLDPRGLDRLSPREFEDLTASWLRSMKLQIQQVGGTYSRDGGVDFFALQESKPIPVVLAVQVKHSAVNRKVDSAVVRDLGYVVANRQVHAGLIVTNTGFTTDAQWTAKNAEKIIRLYGFEHLRRWLLNEVEDEDVYDDLPQFIDVADGLRVQIPGPSRLPLLPPNATPPKKM